MFTLRLISLAATALVAATPAWADSMAAAFGNTVKITVVGELTGGVEDVTLYYYEPDGTVTTDTGITGTWERTDEGHCTTLDRPAGDQGPNKICGPIGDETAVGTTWSYAPADGLNITGEIVAGR